MSESIRVPLAMRGRYDEIVVLTDQFSRQWLTQEYSDLCQRMAGALCRKGPSPVNTGKANAWACGIVYALGRVNFLFDKTQMPHMRADELCQHFSLSVNTGSSKSKAIMSALDIGVMDPQWTLPSRLADNPMAWLIQVNGLCVDVRTMPRSIQEEAFRRGIIPYLP